MKEERCLKDIVEKNFNAPLYPGLQISGMTNGAEGGAPAPRHPVRFLYGIWARQSGFTLIELLVVVLIIGILAAVAVPQYQLAVGKARFMELITAANAIQKAEETYYLSNGTYTNNMDELALELSPNNQMRFTLGSYFSVSRNGFAPYYVMYFEQHPLTYFRGRKECRVPIKKLNAINKQICAGLTGSNEITEDDYSLWIFK